jgi:predicted outer membrane repeat protein
MIRVPKKSRVAVLVAVSIALFLVGLPAPTHGRILGVPDPFPTIQAGLDSAAVGDTVLVEHGVYYENLVWPDTPGIKLFANEQAPPESTVVDGSNAEAPAIRIATPMGHATEIRGFVVCNGSGVNGGGVYCSAASPTISLNRFVNNKVSSYGGGIYCQSSSAQVLANSFAADSALYGGAVAVIGLSSPTIRGNTIDSCHADQGGGIYAADGGFIVGNTITHCHGTGAGMYSSGTADADSNVISSNYGSGFYCTGSGMLRGNNISGNQWHGVQVTNGSSALITGNIIAFNDIGIVIEHAGPVIEANTINGNSIGISCCWGDGTDIGGNSLCGNGIGVYT